MFILMVKKHFYMNIGEKMENVKETIAKNLTRLRKSRGMTQSALAEKLNYSDKAISRWEHAETLPDIETLCRICDIYGVRFEYLLDREADDAAYVTKPRRNLARQIIICLISICTVWLAAIAIFTSLGALLDLYIWQFFIWAIPASTLVLLIFNGIWWHKRVCAIIVSSFTNWTLILSIYLQFLSNNLWLLFVVGVPIQAIIILILTMPEKRIR